MVTIAPNTQQIMLNYRPALTTYEGDISKQSLFFFTWKPTRLMGIISGIAFFAAVSQMGKLSPFLYFQF